MQLYDDNPRQVDKERVVATIGSFDGLHIGHSSVIDQLKDHANRLGSSSMIITLNPHPRYVLGRDEGFSLITASREKEIVVGETGVDYLYKLPFTKEIAKLSAEEFIEQHLVSKIDLKALLIGYNNHLGSDRAAYRELEPIAKRLGFEIILLCEQDVKGEKVSSTIIRRAISEGNVEEAARYMRRPFFVVSSITGGELVTLDKKQIIPKDGRYFVEIADKIGDSHKIAARATIKNGVISIDNKIDRGNCIILFKETILE